MNQALGHLFDRTRDNLLIWVTLSYVAGAAGARYLHVPLPLLKPSMAVLLLFVPVLLFFQRSRGVFLLSLPFFILAGFLHTADSLRPPGDPAHLYNLLSERTKVSLTGRILDMPEFDGDHTRFDLSVDSILFHSDHENDERQTPARGTIRLSLEDRLPEDVRPGTRILVLASAGRIYNYRTPGVFDYRMFLAEQGIHASGKIASAAHILPFQVTDSPWYDGLGFLPEKWRHLIDTFLRERLAPETAGMYRALLIGSRAGISDSTLEHFKATGTMHLLAISGLHMSLLGLMITLALTWILKRSQWLLLHTHVPTIAIVLALPPLILYAYIAGLNTPVLRSLVMSVLFLVGIVLQRQRSILFIVAAAALLMLVWKPLALFTVSFQLSFASILAIAILYPRLLAKFEQNNERAGGKISVYIFSALLVSLAASLGALPFMLFHFNRFSVIGPVMNLLVEPFLCLWALPFGLLAIPLIFIAPSAAVFLLKAGSLGILAADWLTMAGSRIPFASLWTITPTLPEICLYYLLLAFWIVKGRYARRTASLTICSVLLLLFFTRGLWNSFPAGTAELAFLDVGQGNSTLLRLPNGRTVLVDGGSKTSPSFDIGERVIGPYLRKEGLWRIDDVIITHPHSDHMNGIGFILRQFRPERLWINGDEKGEWPYSELLALAASMGVEILEPETGRTIEAGQETSLTFLQGADSPRQGYSVNDRSLVVGLDHGSNSFLLPGDISSRKEREIAERDGNLDADLLLAPHHASSGSGSREFIEKVDPEIIIVSAGQNARTTYPFPEHLTDWRNEGKTVLTTPESGTITCLSDGRDLRLKTFSGETVFIGKNR